MVDNNGNNEASKRNRQQLEAGRAADRANLAAGVVIATNKEKIAEDIARGLEIRQLMNNAGITGAPIDGKVITKGTTDIAPLTGADAQSLGFVSDDSALKGLSTIKGGASVTGHEGAQAATTGNGKAAAEADKSAGETPRR